MPALFIYLIEFFQISITPSFIDEKTEAQTDYMIVFKVLRLAADSNRIHTQICQHTLGLLATSSF